MAYTFWHSGVLIGESDLEEERDDPRQCGGVFRPTAYGLEIFPRLTGILTAGYALKTHLDANGLSPEEMDRDELDQLFDTVPAAQKVIDIGRTLADVEMREPDGGTLEFASIGFIDRLEMEQVLREIEGRPLGLPVELPSGAPRYFVSATLRENPRASLPERAERWN